MTQEDEEETCYENSAAIVAAIKDNQQQSKSNSNYTSPYSQSTFPSLHQKYGGGDRVEKRLLRRRRNLHPNQSSD